ncbi:hypothetical protein [Persephonella sp.]
MHNFIEGKRYLGEFELKRKCEKRNMKIEFKVPFSFELEAEEDQTIIIKNLNPYQINKVLPHVKEIMIYLKEGTSVYVMKAYIIESQEDRYILKLDKDSTYREKRKFHRFSFCCEDLDRYRIKKDEEIFTEDACIIEVSRSGLKIMTKLHGNLEKCDTCTVESTTKDVKFDINIVEVKEERGYYIIRAMIIDSNINLISLVMDGYIKVAEKLILEGT